MPRTGAPQRVIIEVGGSDFECVPLFRLELVVDIDDVEVFVLVVSTAHNQDHTIHN